MPEAPDYRVLDIDLSTLAGKSRQEVFQTGIPIGAVTVVELPAAAVGKVRLHFGSGDGIKLRQEALPIPRNPPRTDGVYLTVDSGVLGNLELLIGLEIVLGV
jgi:hypothetical protein